MVLCTKVCYKNIALSTPVQGYKPSREDRSSYSWAPDEDHYTNLTSRGVQHWFFLVVITHPVIIIFIHQGLTLVNRQKPLSPFVDSNRGSFICVFSLQFPRAFWRLVVFHMGKKDPQVVFFFQLSLGINMKNTYN